jgi:regulatory protein
LTEEINPVDIRLSAMNYLARREHTLRELRQKLSRRYDDMEMIETQIQCLAQENLQSDERFALSYLRSRAGRGFGPLRIRQEMRSRGLSDNEIAAAFTEEALNWRAIATQAYEKKYGLREPEDLKDKSRRSRFMQHRGFTSEHYRHLDRR